MDGGSHTRLMTLWGNGQAEVSFGEITPPDVVAHDHGPNCVCGPAAVSVVASDGRRGTIVAHQPLIGVGLRTEEVTH